METKLRKFVKRLSETPPISYRSQLATLLKPTNLGDLESSLLLQCLFRLPLGRHSGRENGGLSKFSAQVQQ